MCAFMKISLEPSSNTCDQKSLLTEASRLTSAHVDAVSDTQHQMLSADDGERCWWSGCDHHRSHHHSAPDIIHFSDVKIEPIVKRPFSILHSYWIRSWFTSCIDWVSVRKLTSSSSFRTKEPVSQSVPLEPHPLRSGGDRVIMIRGCWNTLTVLTCGHQAHTHTHTQLSGAPSDLQSVHTPHRYVNNREPDIKYDQTFLVLC